MAKKQKTANRSGAAKRSGTAPKGRPTPSRQSSSSSERARRNNPTQRPRRADEDRARLGLRDWIGGARLRTLPLAIAPVVLGTAGAMSESLQGEYHWARALACLAVALCLQIGVNFANDYSDGIRGTDRYRVGPARLTASGLVEPKVVRNVAFLFFFLAAAAGVFLAWRTEQWWLLAVGAAAVLAAWFYTGGKRPYGYYGLGEVFVFVFFGLVATAGTMYVQVLQVSNNGWVLSVAAGLFACAVLMVNNIRDIDQDRRAGKRTLAALIGPVASRVLFAIFALAPYVAVFMFVLLYRNAIYAFFSLMLVGPAVLITSTSYKPKDLVLALLLTSLGALAFAVLLGLAIAFSPYAPVTPTTY
ncbi:1,4-dihydroxy-2-naphthoate polyprenyltransferase [Pseudoclavibacter chungangensis]|uniref:1,4-dihydroxy-2-naphthoate octaprenyltransferase n=1 Tax=Pseudoclavibacter chungangensis TaxID=587635 RepID=A0A7J5BQX7_9MICO|nr:1,4-dihydroxy-2-naphthoate polyprenyltransferase [Pseudoclavibacter chungangensis]KAB1656660.1 1,4-dihydroxy-2-naphthoate polyprenyltransferase [Pseudoclavibacter chungangensis]NYJ67890.1 1,4-dihydroxy-2-naphthoate octaprenyltransferase [Pseudoclavibacter chungangensis]